MYYYLQITVVNIVNRDNTPYNIGTYLQTILCRYYIIQQITVLVLFYEIKHLMKEPILFLENCIPPL